VTATATTFVAPRAIVGRSGMVLDDAAVSVVDDRIVWVGPATALPERHGARVVDLGACTILPGLIDAHVHLGFDGSDDPVRHMVEADEDAHIDAMLRAARTTVTAGVTTVRDLGGRHFLDVAARSAVEAGAIGPRMLLATRPLTPPDGHCWFMGGACTTVESGRNAVRENAEAGSDVIKVMVTGGFMTPGHPPWAPQFEPSMLRAVVEESHRRGLPVAAHAHSASGVRVAVDAHVDTIEHCLWVAEEGLQYDAALVAEMARRGTVVCPTVNLNARRPGRVSWAERSQHLRSMVAAGVRLIAGTDAGIDATPHGALAAGLDCLRDVGMEPLQIIESATGSSAAALGLGGVTGGLAAGLSADLLVVEGDPTSDLLALEHPVLVLARGSVVTCDVRLELGLDVL